MKHSMAPAGYIHNLCSWQFLEGVFLFLWPPSPPPRTGHPYPLLG